ncbi:TatD family hydrolase [Vibrio sp. CDRSL-10 TSBA]
MSAAVTTPEYPLFDTHCHFDFDAFAAHFADELALASQQGVQRILIPSIGRQNWQRVATLAADYPDHIYYALGYHPYFLASAGLNPLHNLELALDARSSSCVAVGEVGLDAMVDIDAKVQETLLLGQLALAQAAGLPVVLHSRKTHNRLLQLLKQTRFQGGGVLHAFSGSEQEARQFIDLGFKIGVGGGITYPRANKTRRTISALPLEHLVLETDAPDMPLCGYQGHNNHPCRLPLVLNELVLLRKEDKQTVASTVWKNSNLLFSICERIPTEM